MSKEKDRVLMWVAPAFKKKIKREAFEEDLSLIEFTRRLANPMIKNEDKGVKKINKFWERII